MNQDPLPVQQNYISPVVNLLEDPFHVSQPQVGREDSEQMHHGEIHRLAEVPLENSVPLENLPSPQHIPVQQGEYVAQRIPIKKRFKNPKFMNETEKET